jgi:hypothetical protein
VPAVAIEQDNQQDIQQGKQQASQSSAAAQRQRQSSAEPESAAYDKKTDGPNRPSV